MFEPDPDSNILSFGSLIPQAYFCLVNETQNPTKMLGTLILSLTPTPRYSLLEKCKTQGRCFCVNTLIQYLG